MSRRRPRGPSQEHLQQCWLCHHCCWGHCGGPRGRRRDRRALHMQRALGACAVGAKLHVHAARLHVRVRIHERRCRRSQTPCEAQRLQRQASILGGATTSL
eukprot:5890805-Alexandrium_andersonii.AAC.1